MIKAIRNLHVNLHMDVTMQESVINVKLKERPFLTSSKSNDPSYNSYFDDKRESFLTVSLLLLSISFHHKTCLKPLKITIGLEFHLIHSFTTNGFLSRR